MAGADETALATALAHAGLAPASAARLAAYGALLLEANRHVNLTGAKDAAALLDHLLDALTLAEDIDGELIDIGSGGGLPGIPLALVTGAHVVLVEAAAKKAAFLTRAVAELGIAAEVVTGRAETVAHDSRWRERFAVATARAVASAPSVAELTVPFLRTGGKALLQRGSLSPAERRAVEDAAPMVGATFSGERQLGGERRIIVLTKTAPTPGRFPRRSGVPQKRPLCL